MICSYKALIHPKPPAVVDNGCFMVAIYKLHEKVLDVHGDQIHEFKAVGYYLPTVSSIRFDMKGSWAKTSYGLQFEVETYEEIIAPTKEGIIAYLSSGLIKEVGVKTAERIYDMFKEKTIKVLDEHPEQLLKVKGISSAKLKRIVDSYLASRAARDVVAFLAPHGVTARRAVKIFKEFGPGTVSIIKEQPYRLCEMHGIGFKTADEIARSMGLDPFSDARIDAGLIQTLKEAEGKGNLCLPIPVFIEQCEKLLNTQGLSKERIADRAYVLDQKQKIIRFEGQVYRDILAKTEQAVANKILEMLAFGNIPFRCRLDNEIDRIQKSMGIVLAAEQRAAIKTGLASHLCVITGGPGTGKSMILRFLLEIYAKERKDAKIVCCAPTGRASRRMEECTGYPASTVHKTLNLRTGDDDGLGEPEMLDADLVLVDESSMLDIFISKHLFCALPYGCQLIVIGDIDQLPSVGPGAVLSELIACNAIPVVKLDKVYRQDAGSRIAINAGLIRHGTLSLEYGQDFQFFESPGFAQSAGLIEQIYLSEVARLGVDNVALLTPYRKKTETGVNALNTRLQGLINPPGRGKSEIVFGSQVFRLGDKVMQIKNKDFINNGDIGYINNIIRSVDETSVQVDFGMGRLAEYELDELGLLELAYACTIHKSQGSEYQSVIINLQMAHYIMLNRPLVYTAITRAKHNLFIVGERKALISAIRNTDIEKRGTMLGVRINPKHKTYTNTA